ncbi:MAG TPA: hypothetical protein PLA65_13180 [Spirochaetota bacterium]|nr:hypothetical protein [Spirochaetota bacterium]HOD17019.1 hypothetical protein [Spirochaetota bacterium]HPG50369.1 hypothetical protein [Spirochaetota bacterium]HPN13009.1 hypothetical protein [Spirochaetota bacterium]
MKISRNYAVALLIACTLTTVPRPAFTASMNIGGTVWFAWWHFSLSDSIKGTSIPHMSLYSRYRMKPTFLYGPIVSIDFARQFSLSAMFIYTDQYRIYSKKVGTLEPVNFFREKYQISRYDLDATFSYSPVSFFKLFTGFKYQGYDFTGRLSELDLDKTGFNKGWISGKDRALGAGLGIGFTARIVEGLFFQWNISALYLNMRFRYYTDFFKLETSPAVLYIPGEVDIKFRYHSYGGNTSMSLAYVVSRISSTIILGFRYQVLYNTLYHLDLEERTLLNIPLTTRYLSLVKNRYMQQRGNGKVYDHFYGVSFAFVYSFELTRSKEEEEEAE